MNVHQLKIGPMDNFCYIIENKGKAVLIDPAWDIEEILSYAEKHNLVPEIIISTHGHFDHVQENKKLKRLLGIKVLAHKADAFQANADIIVSEGRNNMSYDFQGTKILFIHAPGHSPGSILIMCEKNLFTGDVLFIGSAGRTDLPRSNPDMFNATLRKILSLPDDLIVWPGHDYGECRKRRLGEEKKTNTFLKSLSS